MHKFFALITSFSGGFLEHRVGVVRGRWYGLQHVPVLDNFAVLVEAEDVNTRGFLASPVKVAHVYKSQIAVDGDSFDLAGYAPGLLDVAHDGSKPIRGKAGCGGYMARTRDPDTGRL